MGAPKGNEFWKLRSKHGRDKIFTDPDILWEEACKFFKWCDENPIETLEYNGRDAKECIVPKMRAYTWEGLELFLDVTDDTLRNYRSKESYKEFFGVLTHIEKIIYSQKFTGAAAGVLNANIIARDLHLRDSKDIDHSVGNGKKIKLTIGGDDKS